MYFLAKNPCEPIIATNRVKRTKPKHMGGCSVRPWAAVPANQELLQLWQPLAVPSQPCWGGCSGGPSPHGTSAPWAGASCPKQPQPEVLLWIKSKTPSLPQKKTTSIFQRASVYIVYGRRGLLIFQCHDHKMKRLLLAAKACLDPAPINFQSEIYVSWPSHNSREREVPL